MNERFREKTIEFKVVEKKENSQPLNESAQVGDKVTYAGKRGYVIGAAMNGDLLVQIQGSADFVDPKKVKIVGIKAKTMEMPMKFDEKTQKVLFEQFVRCGIYMGNTPIKISNCFVKYSQWRDAKVNENVNVFSDGELAQLPKEQVKVFEDPNEFADPTDYVEGTVNHANGVENVLVNSIDFTAGIGDADLVKIIKNPGTPEAEVDSVPKGMVSVLI